MYTGDVTEILQTNLTTTEKRYSHGRHWIQLALRFYGAFITVNRLHLTQSLLPAYRRDILLTCIHLQIYQNVPWHERCVCISCCSILHKKQFSRRIRNTFPIPEIIFDPSSILRPHVFLLGLIFADRAFLAPNLTSPKQHSKLNIEPRCNALPLPLDLRNGEVDSCASCASEEG